MSFSNLEWYGWIFFVLTLCALWRDIVVAGIIVLHADTIQGKRGDKFEISGNFFWTAIGIAVTFYFLGKP